MKLWLDDRRPMPKTYDYHAKTADEAIQVLKTGVVRMISFDHDLGDTNCHREKTGYDVAKFISQEAYHGRMKPIGWSVHSSNPPGRDNIISTMQQADKYWNMQG